MPSNNEKNKKDMSTQVIKYRIQNADHTFLNAGTGVDSWFTLEDARKLVDYKKGQRIVEHNGVDVMWEAF